MSPWNFVQCRYIYFSIKGDDEEKEEEEEEEKIHGCSSLHTKLIIFEVSVCYNQRSIFTGIRRRKKKRREKWEKFVFLPYTHVLFQLYACLK